MRVPHHDYFLLIECLSCGVGMMKMNFDVCIIIVTQNVNLNLKTLKSFDVKVLKSDCIYSLYEI